ncbi:hypothetical protein MalM14_23470 [Gimesia chilikensis]|jgi:hypothetical protein|nr:hypothetical protein MalM14_23470 [Gimesia chilikensis]
MGASGWVAYCAYESDVERAFQQLRQAVFERVMDQHRYPAPG